MKPALILILIFMVVPKSIAAQETESTQTPKPSLPACQASLKIWSAEKTETLTLDQLFERMHTLVACADEAKKAKKKTKVVTAYLDEFYRTHTELANRTFEFIKRHDLQVEFRNEENNGIGNTAQIILKSEDEKQ